MTSFSQKKGSKRNLEENPHCLIRYQNCNRFFEATQTCFIASPANDQVEKELNVIEKKLREVNLEPYIAVKKREYQKDIFCEKICSKIIESLFCIVILNDVLDSTLTHNVANPNVYYEYGLMTAFGKKIVPLVLKDHKLAFNIQSLDTIQYSLEDLDSEIEKAINKILILIAEEEKPEKDEISDYFEAILASKELVSGDLFDLMSYAFDRQITRLGFSLYSDPKNKRYVFIGYFKKEISEKEIIMKIRSLLLLLKGILTKYSQDINDIDEKLERDRIAIEKERKKRKITPIYSPFISRIRSSNERDKRKLEKQMNLINNSKIFIFKEKFIEPEIIRKKYSEISFKLDYAIELEIIDHSEALKILKIE